MTIETIKDVLGRILVINKNLTEDSLKTLLDASGWDADDIREGLRIFRDYKANGDDMSKVIVEKAYSSSEVINNIEPEKKPIQPQEEKVGKIEEKEVFNPLAGALSILDLTRKDDGKPEIKKVEHVDNDNQNIHIAPNIQVNSSLETPKPIHNIQSGQFTSQTPPSVHQYNMPEDIHNIEEYIIHQKPWLLIIINSILFIITFALLVYIINH
ncbi:MAG: hypothetical protein QG614_262 [Patescibacteria group bacterium]|nr:hypothetical protein [Patescibacteria group bacterium]